MNNKGWGLAQMLILSSVLIIALLIAAINSKRLEKSIEHNNTHTTIESDYRNDSSDDDITSDGTLDNNKDDNNDKENEKNEINNNQIFTTIESEMITATEKLVNNKQLVVDKDIVIVKSEHLFEQDTALKSKMGEYKCNGYVRAYSENNIIHYIPYLSCDDYQTTGYESVYE